MGLLPALPSLLVFGPQAELPSQEVLADLRQELTQNPSLSSLKVAVKDLLGFWHTLTDFDPDLRQVPGAKYLSDFQHWISDGGPFPHHLTSNPNVYALPVTVVLQITQYIRYISGLGLKDPHRHILDGLLDGGAHGFCVGLLSALAVSSSQTEADIAAVASNSVRLAVCIGAYVDKDGRFGESPDQKTCVALRWRDDNANGMDEAIALVRTFQDVGLIASLSSINADIAVYRHTFRASMT